MSPIQTLKATIRYHQMHRNPFNLAYNKVLFSHLKLGNHKLFTDGLIPKDLKYITLLMAFMLLDQI